MKVHYLLRFGFNFLILFYFLTGCELNSSATAPTDLSKDFKDAIQYCKESLGAKSVKTFYAYDSDEYDGNDGLNIVFRNCSFISLESEKVSASIESTLYEILKRIPEKDLPSQLTISLQEDWGFTEIYKREQSQTFSGAQIQAYHQHFHSESYYFQQRLTDLKESGKYPLITKICDSLIDQNIHLELAYQFLGLAAYEPRTVFRP